MKISDESIELQNKVLAVMRSNRDKRFSTGDMARLFAVTDHMIRKAMERLVGRGECFAVPRSNHYLYYVPRNEAMPVSKEPPKFKEYVMPQAMKDQMKRCEEARAIKSLF
jgi:hypothetical protein